jgi:hypothetical protein
MLARQFRRYALWFQLQLPTDPQVSPVGPRFSCRRRLCWLFAGARNRYHFNLRRAACWNADFNCVLSSVRDRLTIELLLVRAGRDASGTKSTAPSAGDSTIECAAYG